MRRGAAAWCGGVRRPGAADRALLLCRLPRWHHQHRGIRCGCPIQAAGTTWLGHPRRTKRRGQRPRAGSPATTATAITPHMPGPERVLQKARLTCYSGRASTLSWPAGAAGDPVGSLPGLTSSALSARCGTLCGWEALGELAANVIRGDAASRADTLRPLRGRRVIFAVHNYVRAPVAQPDRAAAF